MTVTNLIEVSVVGVKGFARIGQLIQGHAAQRLLPESHTEAQKLVRHQPQLKITRGMAPPSAGISYLWVQEPHNSTDISMTMNIISHYERHYSTEHHQSLQ